MKVSLPGRHSLHRSRATGLHDNGILVSEAGPHPCLHGDIDGLCAAVTPWAVPASSDSSEPHPLPETSLKSGGFRRDLRCANGFIRRRSSAWATAGVRCRRSALETPWKRPRATKRKTRQREISLNLLEPASVRDSGDEAKLGATISSHLSRRRSRVRVPSLPPHGVPRPPRLGVGRARRQADRRGALLASAGPSPFEYPHGASDCVIVAPLPRQV